MATAIEHFRNLISLSGADGKIEESERIALSKIAYQKGIPFDRMNLMLAHAHEYKYIIPQNLIDRETQLKEMILFAKVDGVFCKAERELIANVAEKLGFTKEELEERIKTYGG